MRENVVATLLKCATVICFGVGCQRLAFAMSGDISQAGEVVKAAEIAVATSNPSLVLPKPDLIKIAQADGMGDNMVAGQGTVSDASVVSSETLRTARQPSLKQRRRKPRMAGVPSGSPAEVVQAPEAVAPTAVTQVTALKEAVPQEVAAAKAPSVPLAQIREARKTDTSAKSQIIAAGEDEEEDLYSPGAIARRKAEHAQGLVAKQYRRAPIKWGGTITETMAWQQASTLGVPNSALTNLTNVQTVMVGSQTYILKPWIATVFGHIGVISGTSRLSSVWASSTVRENSLIGGGTLTVFSQSRFPFEMSYEATDSRGNETSKAGEGASNLDSVKKVLKLDQTYRPLASPDFYKLNFIRNDAKERQADGISKVISTNRNVNSTWNGNYSSRLGKNQDQPFTLSVNHDVNNATNSLGAASAGRTDSANAQHTYMPEDSLLTLNSMANYFQSNRERFSSRNILLGTRGSWQPEAEDVPLVVKGSVQLFKANTVLNGGVNSSQSLIAAVSGTYGAWEHVRLSGGGMVAQTTANLDTSLVSTQFADASYTPGIIRFRKNIIYSRSANVGFLNQISSVPKSSGLAVYGGASHALSAPYEFSVFGYNSNIAPGVSQGATVRLDRLYGNVGTLTHSASVAWSPGWSKRLPGFNKGESKIRSGGSTSLLNNVTLSLADTRTFGRTHGHTQALSLSGTLNGNGRYTASGYGGNANVSMQMVRMSNGTSSNTLVGNADWGYQYAYDYSLRKPKLFGVRGLEYLLAFTAKAGTTLNAESRVGSNQPSRTSGYGLGYGLTLNQSLRYRIGQNEALLTANLTDSYGTRTASLFLRFRAWRNFGN